MENPLLLASIRMVAIALTHLEIGFGHLVAIVSFDLCDKALPACPQ